jgi:hypothetical protein
MPSSQYTPRSGHARTATRQKHAGQQAIRDLISSDRQKTLTGPASGVVCAARTVRTEKRERGRAHQPFLTAAACPCPQKRSRLCLTSLACLGIDKTNASDRFQRADATSCTINRCMEQAPSPPAADSAPAPAPAPSE